MKLDRDRLNHIGPERVGQVALDALDRLDQHDVEAQVAGLAVALMAVVRRIDMDRQDVMNVAARILDNKAVDTPTFRALRDYINYEVAA